MRDVEARLVGALELQSSRNLLGGVILMDALIDFIN
jgi:hypothetical protein